jgi:tetratricopeptide (TPR) repeat protein
MVIRSLALSLVLLTAAATSAGEAFAQSPYEPCTKTPTEADQKQAKAVHEAAKQYFAVGKYEQAIRSWIEAYGNDCTKHQVFINIGNAYEKMPGQTAKAIEAFETYLQRAGTDAEPEIAEKVKSLKALLASQPPPDNGNAKPNNGGNDPPDVKSPKGPGKLPWIVVGAGGGLAVLGIVFLGVGTSFISSAEKVCGPDRDCKNEVDTKAVTPEQADAAVGKGESGKALVGTGGVFVGLGAAAVIGGVIWWAVSPKGAPAAPAAAGWRLTPGPGQLGLGASLVF